MADWILIPCLVQLRTEFNEIAPGRDRSSDGSVADAAHVAGGTSDHIPDEDVPGLRGKDSDSRREVHALDVDADLRTPGLSMQDVIDHLLARCRSGVERRLTYVIYRRRIWSVNTGWSSRPYGGANPHDLHAHFSASYDTVREASTASWHLEEIPVALTADDKTWLRDEIRSAVKELLTEDADPTAREYSLGGMVTTIERRTAAADKQLPNVATTVGAIATDVAAIKAALKTPPPA